MKKKVLIIDDSALMRRVLSDIINEDDNLQVEATANNGVEAMKLLHMKREFDMILVDINMPKMDGVEFLKEMNRNHIRIPVLVVSSIADKSANETMEALEQGAFDFVKKPKGPIGQGYDAFRRRVLLRVYMACRIPVPVPVQEVEHEKSPSGGIAVSHSKDRQPPSATKRLLVIASSTGGPKALQSVIPCFPADFPYPIVVVQHMPAGFTQSLAGRLDEMSPLTVKEAQDGDVLRRGVVYIAKGGKQCELVEKPAGIFSLSENDKPARGGLRPCADIFMESLVNSSLNHFVCGVLTGMGSDGCKGIQYVKKYKDMRVVAQNEETCVVYGMPRAVARAGIVNEVVPLEDVADAMIKQLGV